ncbi:MAG TPA: hypothetical protein V6D05_00185 [Stenomitos sp.]
MVLLLRRALARTAAEPVSVLVATPKPVVATLEEAPPEPAPESEFPSEGLDLAADVPTAEGEPLHSLVKDEGDLEPVEAINEPESKVAGPDEPLQSSDLENTEPDEPLQPSDLENTESDEPLLPPDLEVSEHEAPLGPSESGIRETEEPLTSEPWTQGKEDGSTEAPWIQEKASHEAGEPWSREPGETLYVASAGAEEDEADETEPIQYRSIDLETLTIGLEASEVQELYGLPGHLSKVGEDGEQWRYHLNAADDQGNGIEGVLVLEFQRGRLVRKALEENDADA